VGFAVLTSSQRRDVSVGVSDHEVTPCFHVRAAMLAAAEDLSKQFVAVLAARRSIEPFAKDRSPPPEKV
jgi:hypothetical protein